MANILVQIELKDQEASPASLCALNAGRAIASGVGATLYAVLPCSAPPSYGKDDMIAVLSRHGADKVILVTGADLDEVALHATHGEALRVACVQFRPRLVLLPSTVAGRDIAPRLAMQLGAGYLPDAELQQTDGDFLLSTTTFRRRFRFSESLRGNDNTVVATLLARGEPRALGDDEAEVVMLQSPKREPTWPRVEGRRRAPERDPLVARLLVGGGAGLGQAESVAQLRKLAAALGAAVVFSPAARTKQAGHAAPELLAPGCVGAEVYLAFGVSGSDRHLASLPPWTRIIAVNTDPQAPILGVADQALIADAAQTINELLATLEAPPAEDA